MKVPITPKLKALAEECLRDRPDIIHNLVGRTREELEQRIRLHMEAYLLPPLPSIGPFTFFPSAPPEYGAKPINMKHFFRRKDA